MEDDDDDFTFPTVAAEGKPQDGRGDEHDPVPVGARLLQLPLLPDLGAPASRPLWPFAASSTATVPKTSVVVTADEQAPVSVSSEHRADEETMDLLWEWEGASATTAPAPEPSESGGRARAEPQPPKQQQRRAEAADHDDDKRRAAAVADAERMDKLWESFNEELLLLRRGRGRGHSRSRSAAEDDRWYLCTSSYSPSDAAAEYSDDATCASSSSPAAERRGYGCAPTMLRASSRAGGAGQFCASPRGRRRGGAAAGWALLLRLFRRLFAVDKTSRSPPSSSEAANLFC